MLGFVESLDRWYAQMLTVPKPKLALPAARHADRQPAAARPAEIGRMRTSCMPKYSTKHSTVFDVEPERAIAPVSRGEPDRGPADDGGPDPKLGDLRFRALMQERNGIAKPVAIRRRFSKRLPAGGTTVYSGEVLETRMSFAGWCLAQALRLISAPLPIHRSSHVPSVASP